MLGRSDETAANELYLYIKTDGALWKLFRETCAYLLRKQKNGSYLSSRAVDAFTRLVTAAAKRYEKEFGAGKWNTTAWYHTFSKATRDSVAKALRDYFEMEASRGELDYLLKK